MSKERLEELLNDLPYSIRYSGELEPLKDYTRELVERVQELEKEFELCDSTMHMIDMTINNPSTSDDDKWEKVNKIIKKYYADNCIHCNSKGFNGLDYCPNCIRGAVIQENLDLEQQNKRYREAIDEIKELQSYTCHCECQDVIDVYELRNILFELELLESDSE